VVEDGDLKNTTCPVWAVVERGLKYRYNAEEVLATVVVCSVLVDRSRIDFFPERA